MKKIATTLGIGLLALAVGSLSFAGATVFSSLFFQTAAAEDDGTSLTTTAVEPVVNPATSPQYDSQNYGFNYLTYRVKRGDNLTDIARRHSSDIYKISVGELRQLNNIKNPHRILAGQKLLLPVYYAKEVKAVIPATVQAAVQAAVTTEETGLAKTKRTELALAALLVLTITFLAYLIFLYMPNKIHAQKSTETEPNNEPIEPEKFLSYSDEISALLQKCTGQDVLAILEAELVEIPRNPGSAIMNKKKLQNLKEFILNPDNSELLDMRLELWSWHIATKMNRAAPEKETA